MRRVPTKWDLVAASCSGEPEEYVFMVKRPRSATTVTICRRGQPPKFKNIRTMDQGAFLETYQWNASGRHLAGTWEPRSKSETEGLER